MPMRLADLVPTSPSHYDRADPTKKASAKLLKALAENPVEKFTRHLKAIGPTSIYQVCLDVWLTLERHGEAATRLACEMMCDYAARNFVLDVSHHVLSDEWREVVESKKEAVLGLFMAAKGWGYEASRGGGGAGRRRCWAGGAVLILESMFCHCSSILNLCPQFGKMLTLWVFGELGNEKG